MRLNTFENSKSALAGLIRAYKKGEVADVRFRNLVHAFSVYLGFWKHADDLRIEERLDEIEERMADQ